MQWRCPSPYVLPCRIWSFCIKGRTAQNWGALERHSLAMGDEDDPKIHAPPSHVLRWKFGSSATKGGKKLGSAWVPPNWDGAWLAPYKNTPLPCVCYLVKYGRSAVKGVGIRKNHQNWERWNFSLLRWEAWLTPIYTLPHMCYHVKFGNSETKGVRMNRRNPLNWERWDPAPLRWGRGWPIKTKPPPVNKSNLVVLRQSVYI